MAIYTTADDELKAMHKSVGGISIEEFGVLVFDPDKCTGCLKCELVCSIIHTGTSDPQRSRIRVLNLQGSGGYLPMTCQNCEEPMCVRVCPSTACRWDLKLHKTYIDPGKCIGCRACIICCPFGHPFFDKIDRVTVKCDLCNGQPECVLSCEAKALIYLEASETTRDKRTEYAQRILNRPSY